MSSHVYLVLVLIFYAVGALHVLLQTLTRRRLLVTSWTVAATLIGFALHTAALAQRWTEAGHFPAVGLHDGASLLAWTMVLVFLVIYTRSRLEALGLAVYPMAFALVLIANLTPIAPVGDPVLKGLFLPIHTTLAFFGYAALFVAFAGGLLYLIQERELRSRAPRTFYYLIPSLERCDTLSARAVEAGLRAPHPRHHHRPSLEPRRRTAATGRRAPRSGARSWPGASTSCSSWPGSGRDGAGGGRPCSASPPSPPSPSPSSG